jgi:transcriptional regulator with XRE-family HTH domain
MSEVIVDGIRYLPMKRKTTRDKRPLCKLLIDARATRRESLQEASRRIGTTKTHLWCLENGHADNPSLKLLQKLLEYYGIHFDEIK